MVSLVDRIIDEASEKKPSLVDRIVAGEDFGLGAQPKAALPSRDVERRARAEGPPTLRESLTQLAGDVAPIALATAGSVLAPQFAIPLRLAAAAPRLAPLIASFLGGTAGGAAGGGVEAAIEGRPVVEGAKRRGGEAALGEAIGGPIGLGLGAGVRAAFGRAVPGAQQAVEFAAKEGLPISPADIFPGKLTKGVQKVADSVGLGRAKKIEEIFKMTDGDPSPVLARIASQESSDILSDLPRLSSEATRIIGGELEPGKLGKLVIDDKVEAAFKRFTDAIGGNKVTTHAPIIQDKLREVLGAERALDIQEEGIVNFAEKFLSRLEGGVTPEVLFETRKRLEKLAPKKGGQAGRRVGEIRDAFKAQFVELADDPKALGLLSEANFVLTFRGALKGKEGAAIRKAVTEGNEQGVIRGLFASKDSSLLNGFKSQLSDDQFRALLAGNLTDMLRVSAKDNFLRGDILKNRLDSMPKFQRKLYSPDTLKAMENLAELARLSKSVTGQGPKDIFQTIVQGSLIGSAGFIPGDIPFAPDQPEEQAAAAAGAVVVARMLMNPKSRLTQFLLTGRGGALARQLPRVLARGAIGALSPQFEDGTLAIPTR